jgi:hypothetical protein
MRLRNRALAAGLVLTGGVAWAAADQLVAAGADTSSAASAVDDAVANVPVDRYLKTSADAIAAMRALLSRGLKEADAAREEKDAVRLTCVNEPVTMMKGVLRVGEDADVSLQAAMNLGSVTDARREFRKVMASRRRMESLLQEAQNCAGAVSTESTASVELSIDEELAISDPYYGNGAFFFDPQDAIADGPQDNLGQTDDITVRPPPASGVS